MKALALMFTFAALVCAEDLTGTWTGEMYSRNVRIELRQFFPKLTSSHTTHTNHASPHTINSLFSTVPMRSEPQNGCSGPSGGKGGLRFRSKPPSRSRNPYANKTRPANQKKAANQML